jgi:hypothetical protein
MRIGRGKKAFYFNTVVNLSGKVYKLTSVHLFAYELFQSSFEASLLGWAAGYCDNHLLLFLLDLITYQDHPGPVHQGFDKPSEPFLCNIEAVDKIFGTHTGDTTPDLLVDPLCCGLVEPLPYIKKPEGIHDSVMPE